jgi:hypothetical protein
MRTYPRLSKLILTGLLVLSLTLSLAGCGSTLLLVPPSDLLEDCPTSDYPVLTNQDLARLAVDRANDVARCNADKKALREWAVQGRNGAATPF